MRKTWIERLSKWYPSSFQHMLGDEFCQTIENEWAHHKGKPLKQLGVLVDLLRGLGVAHVYHMRKPQEAQAVQLVLANGMTGSTGTPGPQRVAPFTYWSISLMLMGLLYSTTRLVLWLWADGGWNFLTTTNMSVDFSWGVLVHHLFWVVVFAGLAGFGLWDRHVRDNILKDFRLFNGVSFNAKALGVFSTWIAGAMLSVITAHSLWIARHISDETTSAFNAVEEHRVYQKAIGLSLDYDPQINPATRQLLPENRELRCAKAITGLDLATQFWAKEPGGIQLVLLRGLGVQLWNAGCWSDQQFMGRQNKLLAMIPAIETSHKWYQWMPGVELVALPLGEIIPLKRLDWCLKKSKELGNAQDPTLQQQCEAIPNAQSPVHTIPNAKDVLPAK